MILTVTLSFSLNPHNTNFSEEKLWRINNKTTKQVNKMKLTKNTKNSAGMTLIELLVSSARDTEVEGRLEALLDVHGYHAGAASLLARRLVERGENLELANAMARRAVRFQGGSEALATLGWVQLERGAAQGAVATLRRALEEGSDSPSTRYRLGRALALAGDTEAARQELRKALEIGGFPDEEQARAELARLEATPAGATR